jgi:hypothetical protein
MCFATNAQIGYLRMLLQEAGYPHRMGSAYAELGATLREQGGTVEDWLWGMSVGRASRLIKRLKWECKLIRSARRKGQSLAEKWAQKFRVGGNWNASAEAEMNRSGDVAASGGGGYENSDNYLGTPYVFIDGSGLLLYVDGFETVRFFSEAEIAELQRTWARSTAIVNVVREISWLEKYVAKAKEPEGVKEPE